jgi:hypothetical protein
VVERASLSEGLVSIEGFSFDVLTSAGHEAKARFLASRCERAYDYFSRLFAFTPDVTLLALGPADWEGRAGVPVYGVPHTAEAVRVVVAAENNPMWRGIAGMLSQAPEPATALAAVYGTPGGELDLSPFFDLLAVHELAHLFHEQAPSSFPRLWLMELFVNACLQAYVDHSEPEQLPALMTLAEILAGIPLAALDFTTLAAFETRYANMPEHNFGWYQGRLIVAARRVVNSSGAAGLQRLWAEFVIDDGRLAERLDRIDPAAARVLVEWPG